MAYESWLYKIVACIPKIDTRGASMSNPELTDEGFSFKAGPTQIEVVEFQKKVFYRKTPGTKPTMFDEWVQKDVRRVYNLIVNRLLLA